MSLWQDIIKEMSRIPGVSFCLNACGFLAVILLAVEWAFVVLAGASVEDEWVVMPIGVILCGRVRELLFGAGVKLGAERIWWSSP